MRGNTDRIWSSILSHSSSYPATSKTSYQSNMRPIVYGFSQLVRDRIQAGWSCDLLTLMFRQLPAKGSSVLDQMKDEATRVYSRLLTRVNRKPATAAIETLPLLIGSGDLPVAKNKPASNQLIRSNDGLHFNALLLLPPTSRLKTTVQEHFQTAQEIYVNNSYLERIHVQPVTHDHSRVVDYILKSISNGRLTYDDSILILPRTQSEVTSSRQAA